MPRPSRPATGAAAATAAAFVLLLSACAGDLPRKTTADVDPDIPMNDVGPPEEAYIEDREGIFDDSFKDDAGSRVIVPRSP